MKIRNYQPKDKAHCIAIFKSNQPKYFADHELPLFDRWLDNVYAEEYFVVEQNSKIIACGGIFLDDRYNRSGLSWGMVHFDYHGEGVGRKFTQFRIDKMMERFPDVGGMVETSQHTFKFYEKMGFKVVKITPDGFGAGLDKYYMEF